VARNFRAPPQQNRSARRRRRTVCPLSQLRPLQRRRLRPLRRLHLRPLHHRLRRLPLPPLPLAP